MSPEDMDELLFSPFDIALGEQTRERIRTQFENYEYYDGKQHKNGSGELVKASELDAPNGVEYDPTRYATNYFKSIINKKARWQMGGKHGVTVPKPQIDERLQTLEPDYEPSAAQKKSDETAENYEDLLQQLWHENKMRARLVQAARDRLIADRVVCKIAYNPNSGKLRWIFRPDTEFIPVFSDDDFEDLIACHFLRQKLVEDGDDEVNAIQKQTFTLEGEGEARKCYIEEAVYLEEDLSVFEVITPKTSMELDFIPVVMFDVNDLLAETDGQSEVADLREQNDVLNQMNEDAIDSLKFEMFSMLAILNAPEGTAQNMQVAPGAVLEARGYKDGTSPDIKRVEGGFRWKEAFKDQYSRVKGAMHEVSGLPQVVPQELNFGGLNGEALQILFHDIITDTEEHWLSWGYGLEELHTKSLKYLQARLGESNMQYDKAIIRSIDPNEFKPEVNFVLPLPDNRKELVELLGEEMANQVESRQGAMERLGVEDVKAKKQEIQNEQALLGLQGDPYAGAAGADPSAGNVASKINPSPLASEKEVGDVFDGPNGEKMEVCTVCYGAGQITSPQTGKQIVCPNCQGDGITQIRER